MKKIILKTLNIIKNILMVILIAFLVLVLIQRVTNNKFKLFGIGMYTVVSESMLPEYEIGDMFIATEVNQKDIKVGDDIVYLGETGAFKDKVITHRVIRIDSKIHTKGINNQVEDPAIDYKQVYGKVSIRLTLLSLFSKLMNNSVIFYIAIFVPFTLLIFFDIKGFREDKKEKEEKLAAENGDIKQDNKENENKDDISKNC